MSLGAGIFLLALGAILSFAVQDSLSFMDLTMVGYILMAAGALGVILGVVLMGRKRSAVSTTRSSVDPVSGEGVVQNERTIQ